MDEKMVYCRNCGNKIAEKANFCPYCGTKVLVISRPVTPPPPVIPPVDPWEKNSPSSLHEASFQKEPAAAPIPECLEEPVCTEEPEIAYTPAPPAEKPEIAYIPAPPAEKPETFSYTVPPYHETPRPDDAGAQRPGPEVNAAEYGYGHPKKKFNKLWLLLLIPVIAIIVVIALIASFISSVKEEISSPQIDTDMWGSVIEDALEGDMDNFEEYEEYFENYEESLPDDDLDSEEFPGYSFDATLPDTVLYDDGKIRIIANGTGAYSDGWSYNIPVTITNNTSDTIVVMNDYAVLNGYTVSASLYAEVEPGDTQENSFWILTEELSYGNIEEPLELDFQLSIADYDSYDYIAQPDSPTLQSSLYGKMTQNFDDSGSEIYNDGQVKVVFQYVQEYGDYSEAVFYIENNTDQDLIFTSLDTVSFNGHVSDYGILYDQAFAGTKAIANMYIDPEDLALSGADRVNEIAFALDIYTTAYTDYAETGEITMKVNW